MAAFVFIALTFFLQAVIADGEKPMSRLSFFDIDLLRYCAEERRGNVMVSPASIKSTLAMLLEGAEGATEVEIKNALRLSPSREEFREQLNMYLKGLQTNSSGVTLQNANSIFVNEKLKINKNYEMMLRQVYMSEVYRMNFTYPHVSSEIINQWVSDKTKGLITAIVEPVNVSPFTEILLVNAMYYKGFWQFPFDPTQTTSACFYDRGFCKKAAMMDLRALLKYAYIDELRAHALDLPYQGGRYSMILLVPLDRDGCAPLIRDLPYKNLHEVVRHMEPSDVQLTMPKFTIDYAEDMVGPLRSMRISTLFGTSSNLSGIFEGDSPLINNMFHKVHMEVDEKGTVAAAATGAMVVPLIENGVQLRIDRPFVFFIRDNELEIVLFEGRIEDPTLFAPPSEAKPLPTKPSKETPIENPSKEIKDAQKEKPVKDTKPAKDIVNQKKVPELTKAVPKPVL